MSISAVPIEGWVVDAKGLPLNDVVVLAHWVLTGPVEGRTAGQLMIMEATTDQDGHYNFPGWGPKYVVNPLVVMLSDDPILHFFKPGYRVINAYNRTSVSEARADSKVRSSEWNGKRIVLEAMDRDSDAYVRQFEGETTTIAMMAERANDCDWKLMRKMLTRMNEERLRLEGLGMHTALPRPDHFANQARCGSAAEWLKGAAP